MLPHTAFARRRFAALYRGTSEIDALVYALYGLTGKEIEIVEQASRQ
jgi:hypothetical protein